MISMICSSSPLESCLEGVSVRRQGAKPDTERERERAVPHRDVIGFSWGGGHSDTKSMPLQK